MSTRAPQRAKQDVARQRLPRLSEKGHQEVELGRREVDPPAGRADDVARHFLERPPGEQVDPLVRLHRVRTADFDIVLADRVFDDRRSIAGLVQNEYPHRPPLFACPRCCPANRQ